MENRLKSCLVYIISLAWSRGVLLQVLNYVSTYAVISFDIMQLVNSTQIFREQSV